MEITDKTNMQKRFSSFFLKEKAHFSNRREVNWKNVKVSLALGVGISVIALLMMPAPKETDGPFTERTQPGTVAQSLEVQADPTQETLNQLQAGGVRKAPASLGYLYSSNSYSGGGSNQGGDSQLNNTMIVARNGGDSKSQVSPGSRFTVHLYEKATVSNQAMPVIGIVQSDFLHEDSVAIPAGAKLFGTISYDDGGERAKVDWNVIQFPDGRERPLSAIGVGTDGQVGVPGRVHSDAMKNTAGQMLTRFVAAYAAGSMQKGSFGANQGGSSNGFKNAVAETAQDRADRWADNLKKEKSWIEISNSTNFFAVLNQSFAFRDPGSTYGR